ncbi:MAG: EscU/YscU/HrcU family type III secretion system export apparatus switch protein, partial [Rhodoferax sp.]|nr:EscU/YscU/HrcU family type III secretion system export apparatus switch protein [Rhodoferax sp.]
MADSAQDKRLPATGRKISKAKKEGQVARSRDLGHFVAFAAGGALIVGLARPLTDWLVGLLGQGLRFDHAAATDPAAMTQLLADLGWQMLGFVVPLGVVMAAVAVAAGALSGGWNLTFKPLQPKFEKLNPISGLGRLFSKQQFVPTLKACGLALLLFAVGGWYLKDRSHDFTMLLAKPLPAALADAGQMLLDGLLVAVGVLALFSLVDVPLQRWLLAE